MDGSEIAGWNTVSAQGALARTAVTALLTEQDLPFLHTPRPHLGRLSSWAVIPLPAAESPERTPHPILDSNKTLSCFSSIDAESLRKCWPR